MYFNKLRVGLFSTNCYIYADEKTKEAIVIDPGGEPDKIIKEIEEHKLIVKYIILTHGHIDHIKALDDIKHHTNALVVCGKKDAKAINDDNLSLATHFRRKCPSTKPDILVSDNDEINFSDTTLKIIETPGHTFGGISIYDNKEKILFSGDTLFFESVGRTDFEGGSFKELSNSIKNKLFLLPDETKVYPGHSEETSIGHEKEANFFI